MFYDKYILPFEKLIRMNISKVLLWTTNILMVAVTILFISLVGVQEIFGPFTEAKAERDLTGATSMTEWRELENRFFDLNYYFVYRDGEVLIDDYMISSEHFQKTFNYSNATRDDFLEVETATETIYMPNVSEKLSIPIPEERVVFYYGLSKGILFASWLFFFIQLIWIRKLIKNTNEGSFFVRANVQVFMNLAYLYIVLPFIILITENYLNDRLLPNGLALPEGYRFIAQTSSFQFQYLFVGLMLLLVAQAFKHGLRLQKEQELII